MGSIVITVNRTGAPYPLSKTFTVADADIDNIVAAYQNAANASINGTATLAQVWLYVVSTWASSTKSTVQTFQTVPVVVPPPITMT